MRKRLLQTITVIALGISASYAVVLCIEPPPDWYTTLAVWSNMPSFTSPDNSSADHEGWSVTATVGTLEQRTVSGEWRCSQTSFGSCTSFQNAFSMQHVSSLAQCHANLPGSGTGTTNGTCWCRMTYPALGSLWVARTSGSSSGCGQTCAASCATMPVSGRGFAIPLLAVF